MSAPNVFISDNAYADIVCEALENFRTETGGILLGTVEDGNWYVAESIDPGPRAILQAAYFEYDQPYVTHLANKRRRRYKQKLKLLGLWHRHPGSMDVFSSTDDIANLSFVDRCGGRAISGLVNFDPSFRLTFYEIDAPPIRYIRAAVRVGDALFPHSILARWDGPSMLSSTGLVTRTAAGVDNVHNSPDFEATRQSLLSSIWSSYLHRDSVREPEVRANLRHPEPESQTQGPAVLGMLDSELPYLEAQLDYAYELSLVNNELHIRLSRTSELRECPDKLIFTLAFRGADPVVITVDGVQTFSPGIVGFLVNKAISSKASF